ncbi:hypothetical protein PENVUL_c084G01203 [Penicillium vulpinum]|uniref:Uncharacterized protein n=1 Tax=Penicillium vulpinum TaxID=29845 RepID=A0A1V6R6X3_9EURO|nr:hypothetical protein PENVUL_c084G01203 [Penicillium vulpinum]
MGTKCVDSCKQQYQKRSIGDLLWDLIRISRYNKYNSFLALFSGVWSTLLAGALKLRDEPQRAGMVWNDWVDRDIDAQVARTKDRPLASGRLHTIEAMAWLIIQVAASIRLLYWMMEGRHVWISLVPPTIGTLLYPYCKRPVARKFGIYPQYVLGLTAACPAVFGRAAIYNQEHSFPDLINASFPLCLFVFVWTLYFNTAYSYQDVKDDSKMEINSSYVFAGQRIHVLLVILAGLVLASVPWVLYPLQSPWLWISWMGVWTVGCVEQLVKFNANDPHTGGLVWKHNILLALWTIVACLVEVLLVWYHQI